jgi:PQQ-dependent catabolism-associated beta-propeller protein
MYTFALIGTLALGVLPVVASGRHAVSPAAPSAPHSVLVFVSNEWSHDVTVVDAGTRRVVATIPVGARVRGIQPSADGRRVYAALTEDTPRARTHHAAIAVIDVATRRLIGRLPSGTDPEQLAVSHDGRRLYVSNEDAGVASIVDVPHARVTTSATVGVEPEGVAMSPDGRWVYVTAETSSTVSVIDTRTGRVVQTFLVDNRPRSAAFSPDGKRAYVTAEVGGTVSVVAVPRHTVVARMRIGDGSTKPVGIVVSPDGRTLYVTNGHGNAVSVIDARTLHVVATIPVGHRPWGIAMTHDGATIFTADGPSNQISVIDTRSRRVVATIPVGTRACKRTRASLCAMPSFVLPASRSALPAANPEHVDGGDDHRAGEHHPPNPVEAERTRRGRMPLGRQRVGVGALPHHVGRLLHRVRPAERGLGVRQLRVRRLVGGLRHHIPPVATTFSSPAPVAIAFM